MVSRAIEPLIQGRLADQKAIIVYGARQTGKTTVIKKIFQGREDVLWLNADEPNVRALFENISSSRLKAIIGEKNIVVIDEAQRIKDIGISMKLITDQLPDKKLIATGSSSFELANEIKEPLTGRKWEYGLFPLSFGEMVSYSGLLQEESMLPHRLVYGSYPEVITNPGNEKEILRQLTDSYLYKDILLWQNIKKADKLIQLLQALAMQIGSEVSFNELGQLLNLDNQTVEKYIQLLEQCYVIFRINAFSRNLRKELKRGRKIYFFDNGIRNALIANFNPPELRNDIGALWENYLVSERMKTLEYNRIWANSYFWRTQDQQEIDYIEERDGVLFAYEFKWNPKKQVKFSKTFTNAYPKHELKVIHRENFGEFLLP
ncbi:MAG: ATP-binding protein [Bacteroides sp.]|jgi:predicted AAA+ superfamily ATPase|nr:ATP-binding protein [Bacteroides sp.]